MYSKPSQTFGLAGRQGRLNVDSVADEFELGIGSHSDKIVIIHPRTEKIKQQERKNVSSIISTQQTFRRNSFQKVSVCTICRLN